MSFPGAEHTCTIERPTVGLNAIGEQEETWAAIATGVACRMYRAAGSDEFTQGGPVTGTHKIMLPFGQDVTEKDRITSVVSRYGTTLATEASILFVNADPSGQGHHVEVELHEVRTYE